MLTHERIVEAVAKKAEQFSLKKVSYFGSYANGTATEQSDLDLLVEFAQPTVSLLTIIGLRLDLEEELNISVDLIRVPISKKSYIKIEKSVAVYGHHPNGV
jgi:predicted nucleotidyltransferase